MRKYSILFFLVLIIVTFSIFHGCSKDNHIVISKDFLNALMAGKEYTVDEILPKDEEIPHTFFSVYAKRYSVNGELLAIYEFENIDTTKSQATTISEDGNRIGNSFISWIDKPHFFMQGRIIVQYVGSSKSLLKDLTVILGDPIAGMD